MPSNPIKAIKSAAYMVWAIFLVTSDKRGISALGFGYRFNRRHMLDRIFERCTVAMVECPIYGWDIIGKAPKPRKSSLKGA